MIQYLTMAFLVTVLIYEKKNIVSLAFALAAFWLFIVFVTNLGGGGVLVPSQSTYGLLFLGIVFFYLGYYCPVKTINPFESKSGVTYEINYKIAYLFCVVTLLILLPDAITSIKFLISGGTFIDIHRYFTVEKDMGVYNFYASGSTKYYYLIVYPTMFSISILSAYDFWLGKRKILLQVLAISVIVVRAFQYAGRLAIAYLFFFHLICFIVSLKSGNSERLLKLRNAISKRKKILLGSVFGVTGISFILYTIAGRSSKGILGVFDIIPQYFGCCLMVMQEKIETMSGPYTFGAFSLLGFWRYLDIFLVGSLRALGFDYNNNFYEYLLEQYDVLEKFVKIGDIYSNAFVTPFYYFYRDMDVFGVVLFSFIWGYSARLIYNSFRHSINPKTAYFLLFMIFTIYFSMIRCWFASAEVAIAIFSYFLFIKKLVNKRIYNEN